MLNNLFLLEMVSKYWQFISSFKVSKSKIIPDFFSLKKTKIILKNEDNKNVLIALCNV